MTVYFARVPAKSRIHSFALPWFVYIIQQKNASWFEFSSMKKTWKYVQFFLILSKVSYLSIITCAFRTVIRSVRHNSQVLKVRIYYPNSIFLVIFESFLQQFQRVFLFVFSLFFPSVFFFSNLFQKILPPNKYDFCLVLKH